VSRSFISTGLSSCGQCPTPGNEHRAMSGLICSTMGSAYDYEKLCQAWPRQNMVFAPLKVTAAHLGASQTPCLGDSAARPARGAQAHFAARTQVPSVHQQHANSSITFMVSQCPGGGCRQARLEELADGAVAGDEHVMAQVPCNEMKPAPKVYNVESVPNPGSWTSHPAQGAR